MITIYRLVKKKHLLCAFDGKGAKENGGRWNKPGTALVYTSGSLSLAAHETFVHLGYDSVYLSFVYIPVDIPEVLAIHALDDSNLPEDWEDEPPPNSTRLIGTEWAASLKTAVMRVPSAIIPGEFNYLLNPNHAHFSHLIIHPAVPFRFDRRMLKK